MTTEEIKVPEILKEEQHLPNTDDINKMIKDNIELSMGNKLKEMELKQKELEDELRKEREEKEKIKLANMKEEEKSMYMLEQERSKLIQKEKELLIKEEQIRRKDKEHHDMIKINEILTTNPFLSEAMSKHKITTIEDYESKILPVFEELKEYYELKKLNSKGNSNAFGAYKGSYIDNSPKTPQQIIEERVKQRLEEQRNKKR